VLVVVLLTKPTDNNAHSLQSPAAAAAGLHMAQYTQAQDASADQASSDRLCADSTLLSAAAAADLQMA
jgi:hypothetical protein